MKNNIKNFISKFKTSANLLLFGCLILLFVAEGFVIKNSIDFILQIKFGDVGAKLSKSVRINFETYNKIVDRNKESENYKPEIPELPNPFTIFETKDKPKSGQ